MKNGYSRKTFNENVSTLIREGKAKAQALAVAYASARVSFFKAHPQGALPLWLTPSGGNRSNPHAYVEAKFPRKTRAKNPVPPSSRAGSKESRIQAAAKLYSDFSGHEAELVAEIDKPEYPDVALVVGDIDFVGYTTVRDGIEERYIHEFEKSCRPLFVVSHDGKQLLMVGGDYDFTERGIVDAR